MDILLFIGYVLMIIGSIGLLIAAFQTSIWWGLGCLFLYPIALAFVVMNWPQAKNPFFLHLVGLIMVFMDIFYSAGTAVI
jgi:uncharacterized membrane protein